MAIARRLVVIGVLGLFFGPYVPGSPYRADSVLGIAYIAIILLYLQRGLTFESWIEKVVMLLSLVLPMYTLATLVPGLSFPKQHINYQLLLPAGMSVWYIHRKSLILNSGSFVRAIIWISLPISGLAILQQTDKTNAIVDFFLTYYSPPYVDDYSLDYLQLNDVKNYGSIAAISIFGNAGVTSVFTGKHSLAVWCLFAAAIQFGAMSDVRLSMGRPLVYLMAILNVLAGIISTSKVFFFGAPILFGTYLFFLPIRRSGKVLLIFSVLIAAVIILSPQIRVLNDLYSAVLTGDVLRIFNSRFGQDGYLTQYNKIFSSPMVWLVGAGAQAGEWKLTDSQYRSLLLIGGVPYFLLFMTIILALLLLCYLYRVRSPYALPLACLDIALLAGGLGIEVYWQARVIPLWTLSHFLLVPYYKPIEKPLPS